MAAEGRTILFSSHILEEVERLAQNVLVIVAGRLAASGDFREIRRLMTDRPHTFTIRSSDDRRLAAGLVGHPAVYGVELTDGRLSVRTSDFGGVHPGAGGRRPRRRAVAARGPPDRRGPRERVRLPGAPVIRVIAAPDLPGAGRAPAGAPREPARRAADPRRPARPGVRAGVRPRHGHDDDHRPAGDLDDRAARRARVRDVGARLRARRRDRDLPAGQADRPLADRRGQGRRRGRAGGGGDRAGGVLAAAAILGRAGGPDRGDRLGGRAPPSRRRSTRSSSSPSAW